MRWLDDWRAFVRGVLLACLCFFQVAVLAQERSYLIAMVLPRDEQNIEAGFRDYLLKRNLRVKIDTVRFSGRAEDAAALISQVRALKPDLIYSWGTGTTLALAGKYDAGPADPTIRDIPIVFTEVTDPVGAGILRQADPPQRNVTGVSHVAPLNVQLNAMRGYRPFKRLGYITNPGESNTVIVAQALQRMATEMKFELIEEVVPLNASGQPDPTALPGLIKRLHERQADVLYIGPSTFLAFTHRDLVSRTAMFEGLPTFCATESIVRKSHCMFGLFSNGANIGRFAAYKATQILVDKVPIERVPAQSLQRFSLLINMSTAKALDLYPPLALLNVAEVIE